MQAFPRKHPCVCRIRSLNGVPCPFPIFVAAKKNGPPAVAVETTTSAADSNFPCGKKEWPACNDRRDNDLPCPILIFVAAEKNGPPAAWSWDAGRDRMPRRRHTPKLKAAGVAPAPAATVEPLRYRVRFQFSLPQSRTARLQHGRGTQAGTGCHEGGIILSKKPPEWYLPLPQPPSR